MLVWSKTYCKRNSIKVWPQQCIFEGARKWNSWGTIYLFSVNFVSTFRVKQDARKWPSTDVNMKIKCNCVFVSAIMPSLRCKQTILDAFVCPWFINLKRSPRFWIGNLVSNLAKERPVLRLSRAEVSVHRASYPAKSWESRTIDRIASTTIQTILSLNEWPWNQLRRAVWRGQTFLSRQFHLSVFLDFLHN